MRLEYLDAKKVRCDGDKSVNILGQTPLLLSLCASVFDPCGSWNSIGSAASHFRHNNQSAGPHTSRQLCSASGAYKQGFAFRFYLRNSSPPQTSALPRVIPSNVAPLMINAKIGLHFPLLRGVGLAASAERSIVLRTSDLISRPVSSSSSPPSAPELQDDKRNAAERDRTWNLPKMTGKDNH
jgi:hypothetical protein